MFRKITLLAIATLSLSALSPLAAQSVESVTDEATLLIAEPKEAVVIADSQEARDAHRMNRGMISLSETFVPKGQWIVGATASYSTHTNDNYTFTLIEGINSEGYTVRASPFALYSYKENRAVGGRFIYGRSLTRIYDANITIGDEESGVGVSVNNFYGLTNSYTAMAVFRQYIPFGNVKRFALFADVSIEGGGFQTKYAHDYPVKGTFSSGYTLGVGMTPGIVAFASNNVAFEVSIAIAGVSYAHSNQVHNQVYEGYVDKTNFNFRLSLLSVGFGISYYL